MKICTDEIAYEIMELKEIWRESCPQIIPVDSFIMKEGISGMEGSLEKEEKKNKTLKTSSILIKICYLSIP